MLNSGGHYDNTTGIYTVPLDGTYQFYVQILSDQDTPIRAYLVVDDDHVIINYYFYNIFLNHISLYHISGDEWQYDDDSLQILQPQGTFHIMLIWSKNIFNLHST